MKKFNIIGKYPILAITMLSAIILIISPVIFSIIVAISIVLPIYLLRKLFGNN